MNASWPVVGRERELTRVVDRLHVGVGTLIVGDAGIGKSTLAGEILKRSQAAGWATRFVACTGHADAALPNVAPELSVRDPAVVVVDDAHLLDDDATQTLWQLASATPVRVVATVRRGERTPHGVTRLWTAGVCDRLDLDALGEEDVRQLLRRRLDGPLEERLPRLLARRSAGNPLLVRELVNAGLQSGAIAFRRGVWQLADDMVLGSSLTDLIRSTVTHLRAEETQAVQLVALAEPLRLSLAQRIIETEVLERLEDSQVIVLRDGEEGPALSCAHPLYREVVLADLAGLRSRRLRGRLIDAIADDARPSDRERLQAVLWRLGLDRAVPADQLLAAAQIARAASPRSAEELALAAASAGAGIEATLLLAEVLLLQGRIAEADDLLDQIGDATLSDEQQRRFTLSRVLGRTMLGEIADALALTGAEAAASSVQLQALHAQSLLLDGHPQEALRVAGPLALGARIDPIASSIAAYTAVAAYSFLGQDGPADQALIAALPVLSATVNQLPYGSALAQVSAATSRVLAGRLIDAERLGHEMYEAAQHNEDQWLRPRSATVLGLAALLRGRVQTAVDQLRIAIAALNELDAMFLPYNVSFFARAAALTGDTKAAREAMTQQTSATRYPLYEADWRIAEAALLAAEGRITAASQQALRAARIAANNGQWAVAAYAAHDASRYEGSQEAAAITGTAADQTAALLPHLMAQHAAARARRDPAQLAAVADRFEQLGVLLYAAEAAYASARAYREIGDATAGVRLSIRAADVHGRCENAVIPWALGQPAARLTPRQQRVALLAAAGHSDSTIGSELGVTIRTVQTHLTQVYAKLHIASRRDIAAALTAQAHALSGR